MYGALYLGRLGHQTLSRCPQDIHGRSPSIAVRHGAPQDVPPLCEGGDGDLSTQMILVMEALTSPGEVLLAIVV